MFMMVIVVIYKEINCQNKYVDVHYMDFCFMSFNLYIMCLPLGNCLKCFYSEKSSYQWYM